MHPLSLYVSKVTVVCFFCCCVCDVNRCRQKNEHYLYVFSLVQSRYMYTIVGVKLAVTVTMAPDDGTGQLSPALFLEYTVMLPHSGLVQMLESP